MFLHHKEASTGRMNKFQSKSSVVRETFMLLKAAMYQEENTQLKEDNLNFNVYTVQKSLYLH